MMQSSFSNKETLVLTEQRIVRPRLQTLSRPAAGS